MDGIDLSFHHDSLATDHDTLVIGCYFLAEEVVEGRETKGRRVGMNRLDACYGIGGIAEAAHLVGYADGICAGWVTFGQGVVRIAGESYDLAILEYGKAKGTVGNVPGELIVAEHHFDALLLGVALRIPVGEHLVECVFCCLFFGDDTWVGVGSGIACVDGA